MRRILKGFLRLFLRQSVDNECSAKGIPRHLHRCERPQVNEFDADEMLYMRHPSLPLDQRDYGLNLEHYRVQEQSVIREKFSRTPVDVLFDSEQGRHFVTGHQIAGFSVADVTNLNWPNEHSIIYDRKNRDKIVKEADVYSLRLEHAPIRCMYPHCNVILLKNGVPFGDGKVPPPTKTAVRKYIARIANKHRGKLMEVRIDPKYFSEVL